MKKILILLFLVWFSACENMRFSKVSGYVFDDETGQPVAGALVKLYDEYDSDSDETDENGYFSVSISYNSENGGLEDSEKINFSVSKNGYKKFTDTFNGSYVDKETDVFLEKY
ncbi:MAG TPA: carboxypeptidase-like regulatory domain-containing protein [Spirochaetota bacterium]|nr:carboxypeptidase-like regulatory domain-containing protein [Spirochaetota bacterium]HOR45674.1 carboxypeptidase-like regulatory domain-containing protein [Spirochaetota bacterium]HPK57361.1 carboxypeptidase-like regulatory domain-containing protein [Spirochaetota bacterium]